MEIKLRGKVDRIEGNSHIFIGTPRGSHAAIQFIYILMHASEHFTPEYSPKMSLQMSGAQKCHCKVFTLTLGKAKQCIPTLKKPP